MVHHKASQSQTIRKRSRINPFIIIAIFVLIGAIFSAILFLQQNVLHPDATGNTAEEGAYNNSAITEVEDESNSTTPQITYKDINFQSVVNNWATSVTGNRSVIIYDLERDKIVGQYNPSENYGTASLYKLFVVYEGYRRVENGQWDYDAAAGSTGYTIGKCLDLAIRESYSPCAETLWGMLGHAELDSIIATDYGITDSDISHLISNPNDILAIMKRFYEHPDFSNETYLTTMWDSFLNQPAATYNWRQGLPSGFAQAKVYNKVGWEYNPSRGYWNIYHDAAIIEFPEDDRHFIVVVMTNQVPYQSIAELGTSIEQSYYSQAQ